MKARQRIFSIAAAGLVATLLPTSSASASLAAPTTVDDAATFAAGSPTVVDVLANDTSAGVAVLTLAADGQSGAPLHGSVTVTSVLVGGISRAALSYTPDAGWYGSDWFGYRLTDESALSDSAVVAVTVTPLPPIVDQLLAFAGKVYFPFLEANARAVRAGEETFGVELLGRPYSQGAFKYQVRCLNTLRATYRALAPEVKHSLDRRLDAAGLLPTLNAAPV